MIGKGKEEKYVWKWNLLADDKDEYEDEEYRGQEMGNWWVNKIICHVILSFVHIELQFMSRKSPAIKISLEKSHVGWIIKICH